MSFLAPLTGSLPQCERSEVKGNRLKPEHEGLNPAVAPVRLVRPRGEMCAEISVSLDACKTVRPRLKGGSPTTGPRSMPENCEMWPLHTSVFCCTDYNWHKGAEDDDRERQWKRILAHMELIMTCSCQVCVMSAFVVCYRLTFAFSS